MSTSAVRTWSIGAACGLVQQWRAAPRYDVISARAARSSPNAAVESAHISAKTSSKSAPDAPPTAALSSVAARTARDSSMLEPACSPSISAVARSASAGVPPRSSTWARARRAARVWTRTSSVTTASLVAKWTKKVPLATRARRAISATVTSW